MAALSSLTLFLSYGYMDAGIASTMLFVYPLMVALIASLCYGERMQLSTVLCLIMALCGIGLLFKAGRRRHAEPDRNITRHGLVAHVCRVYRGCEQARPARGAYLENNLLYTLYRRDDIRCQNRGYAGASFSVPTYWYMWGCLIGLALLPTVVSFLCTTEAIHCIGSTPTAILGALEPLTAVFFGITVFGE